MATHKSPYRFGNDVAQSYEDGVVSIYTEEDGAAGGRLPVPVRTQLGRLDYQERKLGIKRYYDARQNQIHAERVIRVQKPPYVIDNQCTAETEDGRIYRIDLVQAVPEVWPVSLDLTLVRYEQGVAELPPPQPIDPTPPGPETEVEA